METAFEMTGYHPGCYWCPSLPNDSGTDWFQEKYSSLEDMIKALTKVF